MVNINGKLKQFEDATLPLDNRGFMYGDALFETIRVNNGSILFWEDHYFRLMAAMRIVRMQIPMDFTPEFLSDQILQLIKAKQLEKHAVRVKLIVNRASGGFYTPASNAVEYAIVATRLESSFYSITEGPYEVSLYKDHYIARDLLSTIKSNNKMVNVLAGIFAQENDFHNCLLLNTDKMVVEAINGSVFLVNGSIIKTPPISDGCLKGIMRTQLIRMVKKFPELTLEETSISPFELQKADELFITNVIVGIQPVAKYKKKEFGSRISKKLLGMLNTSIKLDL